MFLILSMLESYSLVNRPMVYPVLMLVTVLAIVFLVGCSIPTTTPPPLEITQAATAPISPTAMTTISPTVTATTSPTATAQQIMDEGDRTGVVELDRIIQMVLDGDMIALRSIVHYTQAGCTFEDGLGGPPKCKEGEVEGETIEVLPFFGPEGHFIRKENIDLWILINPLDLYAVYTVSDSAFTNPIYPSDQYAIAFVNEARFMIITLQIVEGHIVRVDTALGNPPMIRADDVDTYLIQPMELDQ